MTSGAIALGARRMGFDKGGRASLADAQAAASVGQIILSGIWAELLATQSLAAAQMLVTLDDGSTITLAGGTSVELPAGTEREARLVAGEADPRWTAQGIRFPRCSAVSAVRPACWKAPRITPRTLDTR